MTATRLILGLIGFLVCAAAQAGNNSAFVSQSVPTAMVPGQTYAVSVTMQNTGTTTWTSATLHKLGTQNPQDNTLWTGSTRRALPASVAPGASVTFNFNVTAPSTPGTYNFQWKMVQDGVEWFGAQSTNLAVKVGLNDAAFVSQNVPPIMTPGQSYAVTVTMNNTGGTTWTVSGYRLGSQNPENNFTWGMHRVVIPANTPPGSSAAIGWNVTAPTTPGTYNFQWKMAQSGVEWFGGLSANAAIKVGLDNAAFVSQTVPSTMVMGQTYAVSVTMQNTGSTTWAAGTVGLGSQNPQGNTTWGASKINLASPVAPGAQTTFNFNVTPGMPGTYNFQWRMVEGSNGWFGAQSTNVAVVVTGNAPDANVHFIHTDHLNTPRVVANSGGTTVWRWDQQEPFGVNVPNENPSGLGAFELPLRFPGQYADKETNLAYNYYREYDAALGRYIQSDPIGLIAGLNTYAYVEGDPLSNSDPEGLQAIPMPTPPFPGLPAPGKPGTPGKPNENPFEQPAQPPVWPTIPDALQDLFFSKKFTCRVRCNVQQIDRDACCPDRVEGYGTGKTKEAACKAAQKDANSKVPRGCYKRHCHEI